MDQNTATNVHMAALQWYMAQGVDEALQDKSVDRTALKAAPLVQLVPETLKKPISPKSATAPAAVLAKSEILEEAIALAKAAGSLEELREAIAKFDGISLKKTATNLVFADGNPKAPIMLVGEAPGADEDRLGKPFVGVSGQLLDKILACIGLDRTQKDPLKSVYISNILNWRPPGNRTPAPNEVELSMPFIERHIQLVQPKILILCGGVSAKALLASEESVSKLRKGWREYSPHTREVSAGAEAIPAIVTYHPSYLLRTPSQKRAVWSDMLSLDQKRKSLGIRN
jgi:uracil-DNA glycosylase family 4